MSYYRINIDKSQEDWKDAISDALKNANNRLSTSKIFGVFENPNIKEKHIKTIRDHYARVAFS